MVLCYRLFLSNERISILYSYRSIKSYYCVISSCIIQEKHFQPNFLSVTTVLIGIITVSNYLFLRELWKIDSVLNSLSNFSLSYLLIVDVFNFILAKVAKSGGWVIGKSFSYSLHNYFTLYLLTLSI